MTTLTKATTATTSNRNVGARRLTATKDAAAIKDRIVGSILGVFIGDALGVGVHWQYDLDKLQADRGFVTDYLDPLKDSFHSGTLHAPGRGKLHAGQLEQQGFIDKILLESLAEHKALDQFDFLDRFEREILRESTMDGTRQGGKYGWTDKSICEIYQARVIEGKPWEECVPPRSDTPDSIVRAALIATLYFQTPMEMARQVQSHAKYATLDSSVQAHSVAFASMIGATLQGVPLNNQMTKFLYQQAGKSLPFSSMLSSKDYDPAYGHYSEPDSLLWFGSIAEGVQTFQQSIQPAHRGVLLYGQFCAFFASVPSAYYCAARFPDNFEDAVLCSVNGGGQNTMRTSLVGALLGARVGLSGIPQRFINGLEESDYLIGLAEQVADAALIHTARNTTRNDLWFWPSESQIEFTIGGPSSLSTGTARVAKIANPVLSDTGMNDVPPLLVAVVATFLCVTVAVTIVKLFQNLLWRQSRSAYDNLK